MYEPEVSCSQKGSVVDVFGTVLSLKSLLQHINSVPKPKLDAQRIGLRVDGKASTSVLVQPNSIPAARIWNIKIPWDSLRPLLTTGIPMGTEPWGTLEPWNPGTGSSKK